MSRVYIKKKKAGRRKFRALNIYLRKEEGPKISYLTSHLKKLERKKQMISKVKKRK